MRNTRTGSRRRAGRLLSAAVLAVVVLVSAGCSILGGNREPVTIYAPDPQVPPDPSWPQVSWQLAVAPPTATRFLDGYRIAVRPTPDELQVYKDARWFMSPGEQLEDTVLRALEDSGRIGAVGRQESGLAADYKLAMDLRRFEADYAGNTIPTATIEVNAKLLRSSDGDVVAARTFRQAVPAAGTDTGLVAQAFGTALGAICHQIAGWSLVNGNADQGRDEPQAVR